MKVWIPPISHFGRLAWLCKTTGDRCVLQGDRSRETGNPDASLSQVAWLGDTDVKYRGISRVTHSQSERRGKCAGRRETNDRKHRKGTTAVIAGRAVESGSVTYESMLPDEPLFYGRSLIPTGKKMGKSTCGLDGVKGGGMHGRLLQVKSGENLQGLGDNSQVRCGIRFDAESQTEALQRVGDGHSTEELRDNKTLGKGRLISLECLCLEEVPA